MRINPILGRIKNPGRKKGLKMQYSADEEGFVMSAMSPSFFLFCRASSFLLSLSYQSLYDISSLLYESRGSDSDSRQKQLERERGKRR